MVEIDDVRAQAKKIEEAVKETQQTAKTSATWAVGGLVLLLIVVFLLGRKRGKEGGAVVEVYKI